MLYFAEAKEEKKAESESEEDDDMGFGELWKKFYYCKIVHLVL